MAKKIFKGEEFYSWRVPLLEETVTFEYCSFNRVYLVFINHLKVVTFKNCSFSFASTLCFVAFEGVARFENCSFANCTTFSNTIGQTGKIKFTKCKGLTKARFDGFKNSTQTLSEMGLYQTFKDCVLRTRKEETAYKKIGIFRKDWLGYWTFCGYAIATLTIPKGTVRYGNRNDKCRCERAIVTDIKALNFPSVLLELFKEHPESFKYGSVRNGGVTVYEVGKEVKPNYFDYIPHKCSYGIHYFYDRELAEEYDFS